MGFIQQPPLLLALWARRAYTPGARGQWPVCHWVHTPWEAGDMACFRPLLLKAQPIQWGLASVSISAEQPRQHMGLTQSQWSARGELMSVCPSLNTLTDSPTCLVKMVVKGGGKLPTTPRPPMLLTIRSRLLSMSYCCYPTGGTDEPKAAHLSQLWLSRVIYCRADIH